MSSAVAYSVLFLLLWWRISPLNAQVLPLRYYTPKDGLIAGEVNTLFQDSRGYLWAGTGEGLSMYDGTKFRNFTTTDGLAGNYVNSITESKREPGTLLIGTHGGGISKFVPNRGAGTQRGRFETIPIDSSLFSQRVGKIVEDATGRLWVATGNGFYTIEDGKAKLYSTYGINQEADIALSPDGEIILGVGRILQHIHPLTLTAETLSVALRKRDEIRILHMDSQSRLWIGTKDNRLLGYQNTILLCNRAIPDGRLNFMFDDPQGSLWLCTRNGLITISISDISTAEFVRYTVDNGLLSNFVPYALIDREENMWIADHRKGIAKWADKSLHMFPFSVSHIYNNGSTAVDANGHFWVAGNDGLHEVWREAGRWLHHRHAGGQGLSPINSLFVDSRGRLWVDYPEGGIVSYTVSSRIGRPSELKSIQQITLLQGLNVHNRHCFIVDRSGLLWCSVGGAGIIVVEPSPTPRVVRQYTPDDGLPGASVRVIFEDAEGRIWLAGFNEGIAIAPPRAGGPLRREVDLESEIPEGGVRSITQDHKERIWLGTRYGGIILSDRDSLVSITIADNLISNAIWSQAVDATGNVWVGTQRGLQRINGSSLRPDPTRQEFTDGFVTACGTTPALVWFTTLDGLSVFEPEKKLPVPPPPVYVTSFEVNSMPMPLEDNQEFDHTENNCSFEFVGLSFRDEAAVRYSYRLLGVDREWQGPAPQTKVTYASLQPGHHTFEVRAVTADGVHSNPPAHLSFVIAAPFWDRWWFHATLIVFVPGIVALFLYRRFSILKRETQRQRDFSARLIDAQDSERGRIAAELHDGLGQSLILLQHGLQHGILKTPEGNPVREELQKTLDLAADAVNDVREISSKLHPQVLDKLGLTRAISAMAQKVSETSQINVSIDIEQLDGALPKEQEIHVYRIVQEALNNVVKHSGGTAATLLGRRTEHALLISVKDNGKGIDSDFKAVKGNSLSFGLSGIAERARILGGTFSIHDQRGKGVLLSLHVPLPTKTKGP